MRRNRNKKDLEEFKLGLEVKDIKLGIQGIIMNIINDKIHVEYKRFKGDIEPFFIEYSVEEQLLNLYKLYENDKDIVGLKNKENQNYMTIKELRKSLNRTTLPDNSLVIIEQDDKFEKIKMDDIKDKDGNIVDFGMKYIKTFGTASNYKTNYFMINSNY